MNSVDIQDVSEFDKKYRRVIVGMKKMKNYQMTWVHKNHLVRNKERFTLAEIGLMVIILTKI